MADQKSSLEQSLIEKEVKGKEVKGKEVKEKKVQKAIDRPSEISKKYDVCFVFPANEDPERQSPFEKEGEEIVRILIRAVGEDKEHLLMYRGAIAKKPHEKEKNKNSWFSWCTCFDICFNAAIEKEQKKIIVLIRLSHERTLFYSHSKEFKYLADKDKLKEQAKNGWDANDEKNLAKVHPLNIDDIDRPDITQYSPFDHIYLKYHHDDDYQHLYKHDEELRGQEAAERKIYSKMMKLKILKDLLDDNYDEIDDGINIDLDKVVVTQPGEKGPVVLAIFPLHDEDTVKTLKQSIFDLDHQFPWPFEQENMELPVYLENFSEYVGKIFKGETHYLPWSLDYTKLKDYFGEKIALYYVFTGKIL